ncbi:hypothetical protein [Nocardia terpenica]|uniref:hypothetical protein n=1 Tax=Nocardia terpenica TaxID=455432 RepID=UPI0012FD1FD0|nr:hypothetical protein [Nocardia terpenica]
MVTTLLRSVCPVSALRRAAVAVLVVVAALVGTAANVTAQPDTSGGTYGFNDACESIHDGLQDLGIPGTPFNLGNAAGGLCKAGNVATHPGDAVEAVTDKAWDSTFGKVVDSMLTGLGQALSMGITFWARVPNSAVADMPGLMTRIRDYTLDIQIYALAASVMLCAVRLAAARASAAAEEAAEAFRVLVRVVIMSGMFAGLIVIGTQGSDAFAEWVIDDSTGGNAKGIAESIVKTEALTAFSPGLVLIFAVVGLLSAILQIVLAVVRQGLLVVVTGVLPLAAASSGSPAGKQFYQKLLLWSIAFVLYKPMAALAYMIAFTVAGSGAGTADTKPDADSAMKSLVGIALLCSVALVLPAIMRLISPVTSMASGASGAMLAGGVLAGGGGMGMVGRLASGAADSRGGGVVSSNQGGGNRPTGAASGRSGGTGTRGAAGPAGAAGARSAGAAGTGAAAAKAAGPYGAAAAAAGKAIGGGLRAADSAVGQATNTGHNSSPAPPARPTGAGSNQAVPQ